MGYKELIEFARRQPKGIPNCRRTEEQLEALIPEECTISVWDDGVNLNTSCRRNSITPLISQASELSLPKDTYTVDLKYLWTGRSFMQESCVPLTHTVDLKQVIEYGDPDHTRFDQHRFSPGMIEDLANLRLGSRRIDIHAAEGIFPSHMKEFLQYPREDVETHIAKGDLKRILLREGIELATGIASVTTVTVLVGSESVNIVLPTLSGLATAAVWDFLLGKSTSKKDKEYGFLSLLKARPLEDMQRCYSCLESYDRMSNDYISPEQAMSIAQKEFAMLEDMFAGSDLWKRTACLKIATESQFGEEFVKGFFSSDDRVQYLISAGYQPNEEGEDEIHLFKFVQQAFEQNSAPYLLAIRDQYHPKVQDRTVEGRLVICGSNCGELYVPSKAEPLSFEIDGSMRQVRGQDRLEVTEGKIGLTTHYKNLDTDASLLELQVSALKEAGVLIR